MKKLMTIVSLLSICFASPAFSQSSRDTASDLMKITEDLTSKAWDHYYASSVSQQRLMRPSIDRIASFALSARASYLQDSETSVALLVCSAYARGYENLSNKIADNDLKMNSDISDSVLRKVRAENASLRLQQSDMQTKFSNCL